MSSILNEWVFASWTEVAMVVSSTVITYVAIIAFVRGFGLRSFAKMSASDFAMTLAVGSLFAATISSPSPTIVVALVAFLLLFLGQWLLAWLRARLPKLGSTLDNQPILLMRGSEILDDNMLRANVSRDDLFAKLREANALNRAQIRAVVFETTGDISVLHASDPDVELDPEILTGVAQ